jgi:hypothetical protein
MASNNSGPLFRGEPTRQLAGHTRSSPSGAGCNSATLMRKRMAAGMINLGTTHTVEFD